MIEGGGDNGLGHRLLNPARQVALQDLPGQWFHSVVLVRCRGARPLAEDPQIAGKLRGAWGEQMKATASREAIAGRSCPWRPPCAFDVFFRTQGRITPALEIPKPYVFAAMGDGVDLLVRLTIFGLATEWTEAAAEALVRACGGLTGRGPSIRVNDRSYWSEEAVTVGEAPEALVVAFETPLEIRHQARAEKCAEMAEPVDFDLASLVATLGNRVSGLARWQDASVEADFRALKDRAAALPFQVLEHLPSRWRRFSRRQGQWIPMGGRRLVVLIEGNPAPLLPLLAIGETCHAGSHASLGLGRYALLVPR